MAKNKKHLKTVFNVVLIIIGTFLLNFGTIAFLLPLNINSGGVSGIGIIVRHFVNPEMKAVVYNIVTDSIMVVLWFVGYIFLGKEFAFKTLLSTLLYIAFNALLTLIPGPTQFIESIGALVKGDAGAGNYILGCVFGGVLSGVGVAMNLLGGGSTGGLDVINLLFDKYVGLKASISSFMCDGTIIVVGLLVLCPLDTNYFIPCLSGIISAFIMAMVIDYFFIGFNKSYQMDIISNQWEKISRFAQDDLGRGTTIIRGEGGYQGADRVILRVVLDRSQYRRLRAFIASVDSNAFITTTETKAVFGEGFKPNSLKK